MSEIIDLKFIKVKGYNCPTKSLLIYKNEPICFCNGRGTEQKLLEYIFSGDKELIKDGKIRKTLDIVRKRIIEERD